MLIQLTKCDDKTPMLVDPDFVLMVNEGTFDAEIGRCYWLTLRDHVAGKPTVAVFEDLEEIRRLVRGGRPRTTEAVLAAAGGRSDEG